MHTKFIHHLAHGLVVALIGAGALPAKEHVRPNIVFILADDLGYGDLGCYGQKRIQTPHLDRMASEGLRFTQVYSGAAMCRPSRSCLMTGMHTGHGRVQANSPTVELRAEDITVPEVLRPAGYRTALFGKWALGDRGGAGVPHLQGFDEWFGFPTQTSAQECYPESLLENGKKFLLQENQGGKPGVFADDLFSERATDFIRRNQRGPFFLFLSYITPHAHRFRGQQGIFAPTTEPYSQEEWPEHEKNFAAMITRMDAHIGSLLALLKELGIDRETIVFFSSDNGAHNAGGHSSEFFASSGGLRGRKWSPYEGGTRVPMIVRWPGRIAPGISDFAWAQWDFLPTAAAIAGTSTPRPIDGVSILPHLLGQPQAAHDFLYWEYHAPGGFSGQVVRMGDWKVFRPWAGQPVELYHLKDDPREENNMAAIRPDIVEKARPLMRASHTERAEWPTKGSASSTGRPRAKPGKPAD